ncbi:longitudinals lacking protein, isoforms A/B/D/L-like isoform X2 [Rhodnius prolixus]|uniref:longitudinals lacking protein, isoforms A/B/D/L-like isoform X2 n=1 Tax=Rhodnius prolixus TaxID=13249 RepID=UPI003D188A3B
MQSHRKYECDTSLRCERCGNIYKYRKGLYQHLKYECGKEPMLRCEFCPHKTKHKFNLKRHIMVKHIMGKKEV